MRRIVVLTLFPEMLTEFFDTSMMYKAQNKALVNFEAVNLRNYGIGPRKQVDDTPYGGGDGMLLKPEPIYEAIDDLRLKLNDPLVIIMSPKGERWRQARALELSKLERDMIIICGRYEGFDHRVFDLAHTVISLGDFVMTGGEVAAMAIIDSIVRLIPGVLGGETSAEIESFSDGETLEYPQYTKPAVFRDKVVPEVLLSGNHGAIAKWRSVHSTKIDTSK